MVLFSLTWILGKQIFKPNFVSNGYDGDSAPLVTRGGSLRTGSKDGKRAVPKSVRKAGESQCSRCQCFV
jgi:hypothetical protein